MTSRRLLGIDFGEKRIGVAVSVGALAVPMTIVEHEDRESDLARIGALIAEHEPEAVVVGLPLRASGEEGEEARRCRRFGAALARRIATPVIYHDERFSTVRAREGVLAATPRTRRGARVDDLAAANILQSYIDTLGIRA